MLTAVRGVLGTRGVRVPMTVAVLREVRHLRRGRGRHSQGGGSRHACPMPVAYKERSGVSSTRPSPGGLSTEPPPGAAETGIELAKSPPGHVTAGAGSNKPSF